MCILTIIIEKLTFFIKTSLTKKQNNFLDLQDKLLLHKWGLIVWHIYFLIRAYSSIMYLGIHCQVYMNWIQSVTIKLEPMNTIQTGVHVHVVNKLLCNYDIRFHWGYPLITILRVGIQMLLQMLFLQHITS